MGKKINLSSFAPKNEHALTDTDPSKGKAGRKKKSEMEKLSKYVKLSFSEDEESMLLEKASLKGVGIATFIRMHLKEQKVI